MSATEPYIDDEGYLVIPFACADHEWKYWKKEGKSMKQVMQDLGAPQEVWEQYTHEKFEGPDSEANEAPAGEAEAGASQPAEGQAPEGQAADAQAVEAPASEAPAEIKANGAETENAASANVE